MDEREVGTVVWLDLSVSNPSASREFYGGVVGWVPEPFDEGFNMRSPVTNSLVAGIAPAAGTDGDLPSQWVPYILVEDLEETLERCRQMGGELLVAPATAAGDRYSLIRDPVGAILGLIEKPKPA